MGFTCRDPCSDILQRSHKTSSPFKYGMSLASNGSDLAVQNMKCSKQIKTDAGRLRCLKCNHARIHGIVPMWAFTVQRRCFHGSIQKWGGGGDNGGQFVLGHRESHSTFMKDARIGIFFFLTYSQQNRAHLRETRGHDRTACKQVSSHNCTCSLPFIQFSTFIQFFCSFESHKPFGLTMWGKDASLNIIKTHHCLC